MPEPIRPWREIIDESREREGRYLLDALRRHDWRLRDTARALGESHTTIIAALRSRGVLDEYQRHAHPRGAPRKRGVRGGE